MIKYFMIFGVAFSLSFFSFIANTQNVQQNNLRKEMPVGLSLYLGGASILGGSIDYFVSPKVNLEMSIGWNFSGGIKYHFWGHKPISWSPYIGAIANAKGKLGSTDWDTRRGLFFPIGAHYIYINSFSFAIEAGPWYIKDDDEEHDEYDDDESGFHPWIGVKIGLRIK